MPTTNEALIHKLLCRLASNVEREADRRGVHPMDFAEVFADRLASMVSAQIETEPTGKVIEGAGG